MRKKICALMATCALLAVATAPAQAAPTIERDKYEHVGACYAAELTLAQTKPFNRWKSWQRALFTTAVIGGGKEWYDARHPEHHTASWSDIAADAVGASAGEGMIRLIHKTF